MRLLGKLDPCIKVLCGFVFKNRSYETSSLDLISKKKERILKANYISGAVESSF